jgi:DNA-binding transcriptional regulator PaaX
MDDPSLHRRQQWVFLAYRLPRDPSTPRITLWRKLRRLGAAQLLDGLVALPLDSRTREQLEWLADEVEEADGQASIWIAESASAAQERALASRMAEAIAEEYAALIEEAASVRGAGSAERRRALRRLRRQLQSITKRDYFPPPQREAARMAVEELAQEVAIAS